MSTRLAHDPVEAWLEKAVKLAYYTVSLLVGIATFFGCWWYAVQSYGWFLGIAFGWVPALILATLAAIVWPLAAAVALYR